MFDSQLAETLKEEKFSSDVVFINITDYRQCDHAIRKADVVAGLLPDTMLLQVADLCIANKKSLISPARLTRQMMSRKRSIEENGVLVLMECGFSPGLDHVTAKKAIDNIKIKGGSITEFRSYHGHVLSEECLDNPWEFKLTEPIADILQIGRSLNRQIVNGKILHILYHQFFQRCEPISFNGLKNLIAVPDGDALYLKKIYQLHEANTIVKGRILRSGFARIWRLLVTLGFTDSQSRIEMYEQSSFRNFLESLLPADFEGTLERQLMDHMNATVEEVNKLKWLGLFDDDWLNMKEPSPASILQYLMEKKLSISPTDRDSIIMEHHFKYTLKNATHRMKATLIAQSDISTDSALTKAIGLITGAALKAHLLDNIKAKGLLTPIIPEIYNPILDELDDLGIAFHVEESKSFNLPGQTDEFSELPRASSW